MEQPQHTDFGFGLAGFCHMLIDGHNFLLAGLSNRLTAGTGSHKLPTQNQPFHTNL